VTPVKIAEPVGTVITVPGPDPVPKFSPCVNNIHLFGLEGG
jgi:hypothetical protein